MSSPYLPLASRSDVAVFATPPLAGDLEVTGPISVRVWASTTRDTDFTAKLIDEYPPSGDYPQGFHLNLTEGIIRARYRDGSEHAKFLEPGRVYEFTIALYPTSNRFRAGHRIRVDISSNFPRFDPNPNTGEPPGCHTTTVPAMNTIYHSAERPSHVVLRLVPNVGRMAAAVR